MRLFTILFIILAVSHFGCDIRKREQQLEKKEIELNQREQELLLRQKTLELKEEELVSRIKNIDSLGIRQVSDTGVVSPGLVGTWAVRMTCIETNCPGSAVGDVKTEQWSLSYQNNNIIARVISNDKLVRVYSGISTNNSIELNFNQADSAAGQNTNMVVRLQQKTKDRLDGKREITRMPENCKIVYSIEMVKQ